MSWCSPVLAYPFRLRLPWGWSSNISTKARPLQLQCGCGSCPHKTDRGCWRARFLRKIKPRVKKLWTLDPWPKLRSSVRNKVFKCIRFWRADLNRSGHVLLQAAYWWKHLDQVLKSLQREKYDPKTDESSRRAIKRASICQLQGYSCHSYWWNYR